jgi:hypothetical protein
VHTKFLVGRRERKRPLGSTRRRWEGNIRMNVCDIVCEDGGCMHLAQDKDLLRVVVNTVMNFRVP